MPSSGVLKLVGDTGQIPQTLIQEQAAIPDEGDQMVRFLISAAAHDLWLDADHL